MTRRAHVELAGHGARRCRRRARWPAISCGLVAVVALGIVAVGGNGMIDAFARQMTYPAPAMPVPSPPPAPLREIALSTDAGPLGAWWLPPPSETAPVLLMLHGNGENLATMRISGIFDELAALGAGVLAIDYPGYGRSAGKPSEASLVAAADVAWRWLGIEAGGAPRAIIGWSLGAAVAVEVAARHPGSVDAAVLLSPWDSLRNVAARFFPAFLVALLRDRYDSAAAAERVRCPTLVVHGERDDLVPHELGARLYEALPDPKRRVLVREAGHNDLLASPRVWRELADFLAGIRRRSAPATAPRPG